eukprot:CAMPEP_0116127256 /NCGR_PEP_ID=MMETSP0329-20121206/6749_1 /TAXON_ID=697910 /ORGANISM="Pseudo-nitzschia arenysensis, Strain B593" /LENGTH=552 /DNA_ID=CAMNT_0003621355 /DNA_START=102 /DNA_END=1760 /DNA_ORIENTATION=+
MLKKGNKEPKQKSRVKTKLIQKVSKKKSHNTSEDLAKLTEDYHAFCTRLQGLVKALMNQHMAMQQLAKAKLQVAQQLAVLSKDTVLYESAGQTAGADRSTESVNSYFSIQEGVTNKNSIYADKYKQFVVDYAQEWYKTITDRVGEGLKKAETMRVELDHYQSKVENLRQSANSTMAKGKQVDSKAAEKLTRNEDKLIKTRETTSTFINDLCLLMEEITERSWRDLHPLLVKCAQFETQVSGDESKAQAALSEVVSALKKVAEDHGIKSQARLKDLAQLDPSQLSTRSKDDNRNLAIENGFAGMALGGSNNDGGGSVYSSDNNSSYFPPGSTAAQGLGGFPVKVAPDVSTRTSFTSNNGAPSTMDMLNIQAAPAPTLDTMAQAFGGSTSAPSSMGAPSYGRMGSNDSIHSSSMHNNFSGAPAPPPSSAPPPPPPSTPGFGAPVPSPYGAVPAPAPMMGGNALYPGSTNSYPQQSPMPVRGYAQQQSPYAPQQSPMPGAGYPPQQTPGGFSQHQTPMGGNYAQPQQSPMGGNYAQQQSMYTSPPPPSYGHNPFG